jgi:phenylpropionate dioxygenase-like ring-hydroxylating dioxygenase large terminal subunit
MAADRRPVPYGGYFGRETPPDDVELTRVGPGTPCGEYLRRFWQPVAFARDLRDVPLRLRIMGEDLVLFRDGGGRVGLLHLHCLHRGTSLEYGIIAGRGIRCCYHGWRFDVDGAVLETPGEPADSTYRQRIAQGAYPILEHAGLIFAYLGPPDRRPAFPVYDTFSLPGLELRPAARFELPCNWLQVKDNSMDPVHTAFLHALSSGYQFTAAFGQVPEMEWQERPFGMIYVATRRVGDLVWVRVADFMAPNVHQFTREIEEAGAERAGHRPVVIRWAVPRDDTHTTNFELAQVDPAWGLSAEDVARPGFGQADDRPYEERQRFPADYDAQSSQRPIAIHALEHLAASDRGVIMLRRIVRDGIRAVARGEDPPEIALAARGVIATHAQDTVLRIAALADPAADVALLRETGRRVVSQAAATAPGAGSGQGRSGGSKANTATR